MSSWAEHRASEAAYIMEVPERTFTLDIARRMIPLVGRIIRDLLAAQKRLRDLRQEQRRLELRRRTLSWPDRRRRYHLEEELAEQKDNLHDALAELEVLGLVLLERRIGQVGFPAIIHKRRAFLAWQPADETIRFWRYAGERKLRSVPSQWLANQNVGVAAV
jgi:hypothetical protein